MMHRTVILAVLVVALGTSVYAQDEQTLAELRARAEAGDAEAQVDLGSMYANGESVPQNGDEAVRWYRFAADQGLAAAQFNLGVMYSIGEGVPQDDVEAMRWYRLAAEQGDPSAQLNLGFMYGTGKGVPQDVVEAVRWYRLAAEQGNAIAQSNLGVMYTNGAGVPQDSLEAVRWYRLAAEQGHPPAQYNLGIKYTNGDGVPQDYVRAHMWLNLAASRSTGEDRETTVKARDAVADQMTREQIAEAQRRAQEWDAGFRLFPNNDSTRTTSQNPSVNSLDFEYGDESELNGVETVYVDTQFELEARNDIVDNLTANTAVVVVDRPEEAEVVLVFRWDGQFGTIARGYAFIGNRLVWEFEDRRRNILERPPSVNFARDFLELIK